MTAHGARPSIDQTARDAVAAEASARASADSTHAALTTGAHNLAALLGAKANTSHGHTIADVTGLQAALDALTDPTELSNAITAAVAAHAASDASDAELAASIASEVANRDTAIAAAVASLTTAINAKQDAATAATDAEVATLVNESLAIRRNLIERVGHINPATVGGTNVLLSEYGNQAPNGNAGFQVFPFDPADYPTVNSKTLKVRLRGKCAVHGSAGPAVTFTIELRPVDSVSMNGGNQAITVGAPVCSVAFSSPAAGSRGNSAGSEVDAPIAGLYAICVTHTGTTAANSSTSLGAVLQGRHT